MTNEQKIKSYLAAGHHVKVGADIMNIVYDNWSRFISWDGSNFYYSEFESYGIDPLPLTPPPYKKWDKVIILDVAREVINYSDWAQQKKDMVWKVFTIGDVSYSIGIWGYEFPYFAVAPYFDDAKQTKIQELESQLSQIQKELELLKK